MKILPLYMIKQREPVEDGGLVNLPDDAKKVFDNLGKT